MRPGNGTDPKRRIYEVRPFGIFRVRTTYWKAVRRVAIAVAVVAASLVYFSIVGQPLGTLGVAFFAWLLVKPELHFLAAWRRGFRP